MNDLTVSNIERQNVLNNKYAVANIQSSLGITGMLFEDEYRFTKKMVADFYEVDERTIERYIEQFADELSANGYILCKGKQLKDLKLQFGHVINVGSKTTQLGLFNFRAFLNIGMLLTESEKAKQVRSVILDIVIATINEKAGGGTKTYALQTSSVQMDMVIDRADDIANLCEMKYTRDAYALSKTEAEKLQKRRNELSAALPKKSIIPILITNNSAKHNEYYNQLIYNNITLKNLFL